MAEAHGGRGFPPCVIYVHVYMYTCTYTYTYTRVYVHEAGLVEKKLLFLILFYLIGNKIL